MGNIIRLLTMEQLADENESCRMWTHLGDSISMGHNLVLRIFRETIDGEEILSAALFLQGVFFCEGYLYPGQGYDFSRMAGVKVIPRAQEMNSHGQISQVLLEFVATTEAARLAIKRHKA